MSKQAILLLTFLLFLRPLGAHASFAVPGCQGGHCEMASDDVGNAYFVSQDTESGSQLVVSYDASGKLRQGFARKGIFALDSLIPVNAPEYRKILKLKVDAAGDLWVIYARSQALYTKAEEAAAMMPYDPAAGARHLLGVDNSPQKKYDIEVVVLNSAGLPSDRWPQLHAKYLYSSRLEPHFEFSIEDVHVMRDQFYILGWAPVKRGGMLTSIRAFSNTGDLVPDFGKKGVLNLVPKRIKAAYPVLKADEEKYFFPVQIQSNQGGELLLLGYFEQAESALDGSSESNAAVDHHYSVMTLNPSTGGITSVAGLYHAFDVNQAPWNPDEVLWHGAFLMPDGEHVAVASYFALEHSLEMLALPSMQRVKGAPRFSLPLAHPRAWRAVGPSQLLVVSEKSEPRHSNHADAVDGDRNVTFVHTQTHWGADVGYSAHSVTCASLLQQAM